MELSVIIPTYNSSSKIPATLSALKCQTVKNFEVIIVVDGSTDNTLEVLEMYTNDFAFLKIVAIQNSGRAMARNVGARAASGRHIIFIDDDVLLFENAVSLHAEFHNQNPGHILVGRLEIDPALEGNDDFLDYRLAMEARWTHGLEESITFENYAFTSANLSLSKDIFDQLGGFDPELNDSEDFDFSIRALMLNIPVKYNPAIRGYHNDTVDILQYTMRQKEYVRSKYKLLAKRPMYRKLIPGQFLWMEKLPGDFWKKLVLGNSRPWTRIFSSLFFLWLPVQIRYRLYSAFIYVQSVVPIKEQFR